MAGLFEVAWVVLLKQSDGFTRVRWGVVTVLAMAASFWCLRPVLGVVAEGESAGLVRVGCAGLILAGVAGLRLGG